LTLPARPLSPLDFLSTDQIRQYIANRQADAISREAALRPEGPGLVHIKTSDVLASAKKKPYTWDGRISCETGVPQAHEYGTSIPLKTFHPNADAVEIDQRLMRLKRLKKNVITSARLHSKEAPRGSKALMVTLTYRESVEWHSEQMSRYIKHVREWLKRKGHPFRYTWVFELTKRGRPHYHVLVWLPKGLTMPKADKRGWWPHGMTRTEWARNAVGYLAKYASKGTDDVLPKGVRLYGVGGLSAPSRLVRAWWNLPVSVRKWGFPSDRWRRADGGGWVCRASGEWRESLWSVQLVAGRVFAVPRPHTIASPFDALHQALLSVIPRSIV